MHSKPSVSSIYQFICMSVRRVSTCLTVCEQLPGATYLLFYSGLPNND
jgi:hypothetical protein